MWVVSYTAIPNSESRHLVEQPSGTGESSVVLAKISANVHSMISYDRVGGLQAPSTQSFMPISKDRSTRDSLIQLRACGCSENYHLSQNRRKVSETSPIES